MFKMAGRLGGSVSLASDLAQVMILRSVGLSPMSGSVLKAWNLEPALDSVFPSLSLSAPPLLMLSLSLCLCLTKINKKC